MGQPKGWPFFFFFYGGQPPPFFGGGEFFPLRFQRSSSIKLELCGGATLRWQWTVDVHPVVHGDMDALVPADGGTQGDLAT